VAAIVEGPKKSGDLAGGQLVGQAGVLQRDAEPLTQVAVGMGPTLAEDFNVAGGRSQSRPSRISIVVVLPAPLGPSRPKHSPPLDFKIEAIDGANRLRSSGGNVLRDRGSEWRASWSVPLRFPSRHGRADLEWMTGRMLEKDKVSGLAGVERARAANPESAEVCAAARSIASASVHIRPRP